MEGLKIDACNMALREIHQAIASDPIVNDKIRIGVISFSDSAEVIHPLSKMTDVVDFPALVVKGGSNYESAFTCLKQTIQDDIAALKAHENIKVVRPIVFFISDGEPTDTNWQAALAAVADKNWSFSPHIIAFGVSGARAENIQKVATKSRHGNQFAFLADDNADPGAVFKEVFKSFVSTIAGSAPTLNPTRLNLPRNTFSLVPLYLIIDESAALDEPSILALNHHLLEIHKAISLDPLMNKSVRVSIVSFSDSAEVLLPLSNLNEVTEYPGLMAKGAADYHKLFLKLQDVLIRDCSESPATIDRFARPLIFILAASNPSDESWRVQREKLVDDPRFHSPHIVVLGVGEAKAGTMSDIATSSPLNKHPMAYRMSDATYPSELIRDSLNTLYFE